MTAADLTVVANFHREGPLAFAALASAFEAVDAAEERGARCGVLAVLDRPDEATRAEVRRYSDRLEGIHEIDAGDLAAARNHGLERVGTPWAALLDGDDLFDRSWLWKGLRTLRGAGGGPAVAHARVRLSFGSEQHGRVQVGSGSPYFHPLHLVASWHWAGDTIGPADLFRSLPFVPNDHAAGFGGEDWLWSCESVALGVRHLVVPETAYFYRRQSAHASLGSLPGVTYRRTRLFDADVLDRWKESPALAAINLSRRLEGLSGPGERWERPPGWLRAAVRRASRLDLEVHALGLRLSTLPLETMPLFPGVGRLYATLAGLLDRDRERVVLLCDRLTPEVLGPIAGFLKTRSETGDGLVDVLVLSLAVKSGPAPAPLDEPVTLMDGERLRARHVDLGADAAYGNLWEGLRQDLLVRFLVQNAPLLAVGLDSWAFDRIVARWGDLFRSAGVRTARLLDGRYRGEGGFVEALRSVARGEASYELYACADPALARRLAPELPLPSQAAVGPVVREDERDGGLGAVLAEVPLPGPEALRDAVSPGPAVVSPRDPAPDVSCVVRVRGEGRGLVATLQGLAAARRELEQGGRTSEVIVVAERLGARTRAVVESLESRLPGARLIAPQRAGEGAAVNAGVAAARGSFVALLGGGDVVSSRWLAEALAEAERSGAEVVVRPWLVVPPGPGPAREQPDMRDPSLDLGLLSAGDLWTPVALARRELFLRFAWHDSAPNGGWDHVSWHWSCETVAGGCRHVVAARTAAFLCGETGGERDLSLGRRGAGVLPPSRFLRDQPWLEHRKDARAGERRVLPAGWCDSGYLNAYPDVAAAVRTGAFESGWSHYCLCGRGEQRVPAWRREAFARAPQGFRGRAGHLLRTSAESVRIAASVVRIRFRRAADFVQEGRHGGPGKALAWLGDEARRTADAVPSLAIREPVLAIRRRTGGSAEREAYRRSWEIVARSRPTHVLLVPRLGPGGGELAARLSTDAILSDSGCRVLLVVTDTAGTPRVEGGTDREAVLPFGEFAADLPPDAQVELLCRLLVNAPARVIHAFYSHLGWEALRRHAAPLAECARLYASVFSVPPVETALDAGYARLLPGVRRHLTAVFTDNQRAAGDLVRSCGLEPRQVVVLRHPVRSREPFRVATAEDARILWAGRLDPDKRPDLLTQIATRMPTRRFDVWGEPVLDDGRLFAPLARLPNVRMRGRFDGFGAIPDAPYHCFLYTSRWDGLPNVLLEAVASGLLAVGSDVGGVREVLGDGCGVLVRPSGDPDAYVEALERSFAGVVAARETAERGRTRVVQTHTREAFLGALAAVPGYL